MQKRKKEEKNCKKKDENERAQIYERWCCHRPCRSPGVQNPPAWQTQRGPEAGSLVSQSHRKVKYPAIRLQG